MGCVVPAAFCIRCFYGCRFARLSDVLCPLLLRMEGLGGSSAGLFFPGFSSRAFLLGLLCLVRVNCRKLYRMLL